MPHHRSIRLLPEVLRNQIAAGEVIDRPAGVLKELVENSLDSGATEIAVSLQEGGIGLVAVRDNGHGIPADELEAAVTRHATSKVTGFHDLLHVASYGFRGEALASIGSVSDLLLESACLRKDRPGKKDKEASGPERSGTSGHDLPPAPGDDTASRASGACIRVRHGVISAPAPSAVTEGTSVEVRDLFANVPARLKFLKNPATELKRCRELLLRPALAHLDTTFSLHLSGTGSRGQELLRLPAGLSLQDRLMLIWPPQIVENLRPFAGEHNGIRAHGLMSPPHNSQVRGDRILLYVNGRPVANRIVFQAVREAYKGRLTTREYPQVLLFLEPDHGDVDVNVHPAKTEVRFREERAVFSAVVNILSSSAVLGGSPFQAGRETPYGIPAEQEPDTYDSESRAAAQYLRERHVPENGGPTLSDTDGPGAMRDAAGNRDPGPHGAYGRIPESFGSGAKTGMFPPLYAASDAHESAEQAVPQGTETGGARAEEALRAVRPPGFWGSLDRPRLVDVRPAESSSEQEEPVFETRGYARERRDKGYPVAVGDLVCLGQLADTYLILVRGGTLLLVDQHAAHERVLMESFERAASSGTSRLLMLPEKIPLHPAEEERLRSCFAMLTRFGYDLELEQTVLYVRGTPPMLEQGEAVELLRAVLAERADGPEDILHLMSCRSAVRAGQALTGDEAAELLKSWLETPDCEFCPHGRPAVLEFTPEHLEKMFKRKIG
ncbi:MAG: DNA mismatch repair endonuclease MutL [Desulfovibrio sp.]|nr:DNA mismatch repair endonuclease MutL [Desulfovibrio sp.]